jgi:hypothetical protein
MYTGFYRKGQHIHGNEGYTRYFIQGGVISGPKGKTHYYISNDCIFGPKGYTHFFFSDQNLCGPSKKLPWIPRAERLPVYTHLLTQAPRRVSGGGQTADKRQDRDSAGAAKRR